MVQKDIVEPSALLTVLKDLTEFMYIFEPVCIN